MHETNDWFEKIWEYREEVVYPAIFGGQSECIFTVPQKRLEMGQLTDPRWATCGVFRFAPTRDRRSWIYVSSGLSNAWFDERPDLNGVSGFGCEFVMETPEKNDWAIQRLHQIICYQIALCVGLYPGSEPLFAGYSVPLGSPIDFQSSLLNHVLLIEPTRFDPLLRQESGMADFLQLVGISEKERDLAKLHGNQELIDRLSQETSYPETDSKRQEVSRL